MLRFVGAMTALISLLLAAGTVLPMAIEAGRLYAILDDPPALADRALAGALDTPRLEAAIRAALSDNDAELAASFVDLAREQNVALDPFLVKDVEAANGTLASTLRNATGFARGLVVGEPDDLASLAGTVTGDLLVIGDVRDLTREGARWVNGGEPDPLVVGLAAVGIAATAATAATVGLAAPARVGLSLVKGARKAGRLGGRLSGALTRTVSEAVDFAKLKGALAGAKLTDPQAAAVAVRASIRADRTAELTRVMADVGTIHAKIGTRGTLSALSVADDAGDIRRLTKLADAKGGKTRAILKLAGRSAIVASTAIWTLAGWVGAGLLNVIGMLVAVKAGAEALTRILWPRRRREATAT
jgi:hypothetical protein